MLLAGGEKRIENGEVLCGLLVAEEQVVRTADRKLVMNRAVDPGKVFDLTLPLEQAAEGYRTIDERRVVKVLLRP